MVAPIFELGAYRLDLGEVPTGQRNVRALGARGDGVTDDTDIIQAAVDKGGVILFPHSENYYRTTRTIILKDGTHLIGVHGHYASTAGRVQIRLDDGIAAPAMANADQVNGNKNITIENLVLVGSNAAGADTVRFKGTTGFCQGIRIKNSLIRKAGRHTLYWENVKESEICNSWFMDALDDAIHFYTSPDNLIIGCVLMAVDDGIVLENHSSHNIISNSFMFLCNHGIAVIGGYRNVIANNRVNTSKREGIWLNPTANTRGLVAYNLIQGNMLYDNGAGLAGTRAGILLEGYADNNTLAGNYCTDARAPGTKTQFNGIRIAGDATANMVSGNTLVENEGVGFADMSTGLNMVYGNRMGPTTAFDAAGLTVGGGTEIKGHLSASVNLDPASIPDGGVLSFTVALPGAAQGDICQVSMNTLGVNVVLLSAHVQAPDVVRVTMYNRQGAALDFPLSVVRVAVWKY